MADNYIFPNNQSVFVPTLSTQLQVDYTRNVNSFPILRYVDITPTEKTKGYYVKFKAEDQARAVHVPNDFVWAPGSDRPRGTWNNEMFEFQQYSCVRYNYPFRIGWLEEQQAAWDLLSKETSHKAAQAMTCRAIRIANLLTTSANWPAASTATATALGGGTWDDATATNPYILKSILAAVNLIVTSTNGAVQYEDLRLVFSPTVAALVRESEEFIDFIKQQPSSPAIWSRDNFNNGRYGLPPYIYGLEVVVDDTVEVTTPPVIGSAAATNRAFVWPAASAAIVTKKRMSTGDGSTYSTATLFSYSPDEMAVEVFNDAVNRVYLGGVTENTAEVLVAPESGFLITNLHS